MKKKLEVNLRKLCKIKRYNQKKYIKEKSRHRNEIMRTCSIQLLVEDTEINITHQEQDSRIPTECIFFFYDSTLSLLYHCPTRISPIIPQSYMSPQRSVLPGYDLSFSIQSRISGGTQAFPHHTGIIPLRAYFKEVL